MRNTFDMDNLFFRFTSRIADIFILNLIFVITCIPVFTIGAAVTALISTSLKNFPFTVLMMVCLAVVTAAVYFLNAAKVFMLLFGFGLYGYLTAFIYRRIYREYIEDEPDEEVEE